VSPGVFWDMHKLLFKRQDRLEDEDLRRYAALVGADPDLAAGEAAQAFAPKVQADYATGVEAGVRGTATLHINGDPYHGRVKRSALREATGTSR
jgi:protein-disulfide isomerase